VNASGRSHYLDSGSALEFRLVTPARLARVKKKSEFRRLTDIANPLAGCECMRKNGPARGDTADDLSGDTKEWVGHVRHAILVGVVCRIARDWNKLDGIDERSVLVKTGQFADNKNDRAVREDWIVARVGADFKGDLSVWGQEDAVVDSMSHCLLRGRILKADDAAVFKSKVRDNEGRHAAQNCEE